MPALKTSGKLANRRPVPRTEEACTGQGVAVVFGRLRAGLFGICMAALVAVMPACSDEQPQMETVVSEVNNLDRPEIVDVLFHPIKTGRVPGPEGSVDIDITVAEGVSLGCRLFTNSLIAPTLIFFHGNGETVPDYDGIGPFYVQEGMNFLVTDYRGYGWSTGKPLTSAMLADSNSLFLQLKDWLAANGYTGPLFVMGRSLGSASAIEVAVSHSDDLTGLIIESGFAQTLPLAKTLGVDLEQFGITEEMTFANASKIERFIKPTYILHGQRDQLIPLWQAETLAARSGAKNREFQVVPGADHNTLIAVAGRVYFQAISQFVQKAAGIAPDWRDRRRAFKAKQAEQAGR
ncbi:MAG: alpha/beta hydrolase [Desulfobulbus sp.]|nr:alpha/beta hydrolase [Desulfobulbus sp.]